jgi:hypothetical protein
MVVVVVVVVVVIIIIINCKLHTYRMEYSLRLVLTKDLLVYLCERTD